jgi:hypothetical protein
MFPSVLPRQIRENPLREAEVTVFDLLEAQFGPEWTVFYSSPWLGLTHTGVERDGEADFVVVHPDRGYLTIEVKGGTISFNPATGQWQSKDRRKIDHDIKNPVEQARSAKHELLRKLKDAPSWPNRFIRMRHGVVFPDCLAPKEALGADMPPELFCCRPDLPRLSQWIRQRLSSGDEAPLGEKGVQAFREVLAKPFELSVPIAHYIDDDEHAIAMLTPQQFHILTAVEANPRMAAGGGAGTGKTILAVEDAMRRSREGLRTALVCLSTRLSEHLKKRLQSTTVEVWNLAALCNHLAGEAGIAVPSGGFPKDQLADVLCRAIKARPDLRYDAIIIDEGQDIRSTLWIAFEDLLQDPDRSILHVFFDTNQTVYGDISRELASFRIAPVRLTRNLRNTRLIHDAASKFYNGTELVADGPDGRIVEWAMCSTRNMDLKVIELVRRLTDHDEINPEKIVVLCVSDAVTELLTKKLAGFEGITVDHVQDFKGLEMPVVILAAGREIADVKELAYVALSRARAHLLVVGEHDILEWLGRPSA